MSEAAHRLHLLRHAKSSWGEPGAADRDRGLNGRGRRACGLVATMLAEEGVRPDAVIISPARRAQLTFEGIRGGLEGEYEQWTEERVYGASTPELLDLISELPESVGSAMLIGHNPGLGDLALDLAGGEPGAEAIRHKFPTAALASFKIASPWLRVRPAAARLERFVRPKELGQG